MSPWKEIEGSSFDFLPITKYCLHSRIGRHLSVFLQPLKASLSGSLSRQNSSRTLMSMATRHWLCFRIPLAPWCFYVHRNISCLYRLLSMEKKGFSNAIVELGQKYIAFTIVGTLIILTGLVDPKRIVILSLWVIGPVGPIPGPAVKQYLRFLAQ